MMSLSDSDSDVDRFMDLINNCGLYFGVPSFFLCLIFSRNYPLVPPKSYKKAQIELQKTGKNNKSTDPTPIKEDKHNILPMLAV